MFYAIFPFENLKNYFWDVRANSNVYLLNGYSKTIGRYMNKARSHFRSHERKLFLEIAPHHCIHIYILGFPVLQISLQAQRLGSKVRSSPDSQNQRSRYRCWPVFSSFSGLWGFFRNIKFRRLFKSSWVFPRDVWVFQVIHPIINFPRHSSEISLFLLKVSEFATPSASWQKRTMIVTNRNLPSDTWSANVVLTKGIVEAFTLFGGSKLPIVKQFFCYSWKKSFIFE